MTEKEVENQILSWAFARGYFAFKVQKTGLYDPTKGVFRKTRNPYHINGISDILLVIKGRFVACEVKKPTWLKSKGAFKIKTQEDLHKMASPDQIKFINRVNAEGGLGFFADSLEMFKEHVK
jgi:penicillin-binding protein-related factor A (putative recombinase)